MITAKEIQTEVLTAQQALLREANEIVSGKKRAEAHAKGLAELGFTGAADALTRKMEEAKRLHDLADQYSFEYPGLKFIPEQAMATVCRKYGLARGHVSRYMGEVPEWALAQIKDNKRHIPAVEIYDEYVHYNKYVEAVEHDPHLFMDVTPGQTLASLGGSTYRRFGREHGMVSAPGIYIAAPKAEMRLGSNEIVAQNGDIVELPSTLDPIVYLKVNGGCIVLAAWGEEGRDPEVFNVASN